MAGRFSPGEHLEPVTIGQALNSSITPVRDALHRLVGERLVEAPRNDGFRSPTVSELGLRQLYGWQVELARLALARLLRRPCHAGRPFPDDRDFPSVPAIFLAVAQATGDADLFHALLNACERLASISQAEQAVLPDLDEELEAFHNAVRAKERSNLRAVIGAYHRRRDRAVPRLVEAIQRTL